jgi:hypothetical protein
VDVNQSEKATKQMEISKFFIIPHFMQVEVYFAYLASWNKQLQAPINYFSRQSLYRKKSLNFRNFRFKHPRLLTSLRSEPESISALNTRQYFVSSVENFGDSKVLCR